MTTMFNSRARREFVLGVQVSRPAAALPQTTQAALFTVAGGRVMLTSIVGQVATVIQTQANNTKLVANPTTGTDVDLCAVLNISADEVGTLYGISGLFADAMKGVNAGAVEGMERCPIVAPGTIDLSCAASNTGAVKWDVTYLPIDDGATLVAA